MPTCWGISLLHTVWRKSYQLLSIPTLTALISLVWTDCFLLKLVARWKIHTALFFTAHFIFSICSLAENCNGLTWAKMLYYTLMFTRYFIYLFYYLFWNGVTNLPYNGKTVNMKFKSEFTDEVIWRKWCIETKSKRISMTGLISRWTQKNAMRIRNRIKIVKRKVK